MTATVEIRGTVSVSGSSCVSSCGGGGADRHVQSISTGDCGAVVYASSVQTPSPIQVATAGVIGAEFIDLDILGQLSAIEFLSMETTNELIVRVGAMEASLLGSSGTFPTGFAGGETFTFTVGSTAVSVTFDAADQTAAQVVSRINAACAFAGLASPRAVVDASGQVRINGVETGFAAEVAVTGGTGAATIGFAGTPSANGSGADNRVNGLFLAQFARYPNAPTRIQVSGTASAELTAAGRSDA